MMSRGISLTYISFHSAPYLGEQSKQKLAALVKQLSRFQPYLLRQIFLLTLSPFRSTDLFASRYPNSYQYYRKSLSTDKGFSWSRPVPSRRSMKETFPWSRLATMRPART